MTADVTKDQAGRTDASESADELEEESPVFNYSNAKEVSSLFSYDREDDEQNLPSESSEDSLLVVKKRSVMSAIEVDGLEETDFRDQGRVAGKSEGDVGIIIKQIRNIVLFEGFDEEELRLVTEYMYVQHVSQNDVVIKVGSIGDAIYVVKSGTYMCIVPCKDSEELTVKTYEGEGFFGELALINHTPRAATIIALTDGELWVLRALRHAWLRKNRAMLNAERFEAVVKAIPLFRDNLNPSLTSRLIDALEVVNLNPGDIICQQGDCGDAMYFIMQGEVEATINTTPVRIMVQNEFFGERALVLDEGRAATCCAKTSVSLAKLPKESFELIIPDSVVNRMRQHIATSYAQPAAEEDED